MQVLKSMIRLREGLWRVLRMYGVNGILLNVVKRIYNDNKACVSGW